MQARIPCSTSTAGRPGTTLAALLAASLAGCVSSGPAPRAPASAASKPASAAGASAAQKTPSNAAQNAAGSTAQNASPAAPQGASGKAPAQDSAQAAEPALAKTVAASQAPPGAELSGFVSTKLVARTSSGDHDFDLSSVVSLDYADARHPWIKAHVMGRLSADLDGHQADGTFNGLADLHDQALDFKLYDAYLDLTPPEGLGHVRLGRQLEYLTPEVVHYDGLSFDTKPSGDAELSAGFYGGAPVHLYEAPTKGASLIGAFVEGRPWHGGRARLDWMHLEDELVLGPVDDDLFGLGLWENFGTGWTAEAQYTRVEGRDRDLRLRTQYADATGEFSVRARWYQLFQTQNQLPEGIDPYTTILLELFPYSQAGLGLSTALSERLSLDLDFDQRSVDDSGDVGEFNRDWERYRATLVWHDAFTQHLDVSLIGDVWDGRERDTSTWGADLAYDTQAQWKFSAGSYYSLYKYDLLQNSERDDVRTWYGRAVYQVGPQLRLEMTYDYEDDDYQQYHTLRGGALWRF